jgi:hypothetical protein
LLDLILDFRLSAVIVGEFPVGFVYHWDFARRDLLTRFSINYI